jgi:hypothetical protein
MAFMNLPTLVHRLVEERFTKGRQLDRQNAHPSSIGSDFRRLGIDFWKKVDEHRPKNGTSLGCADSGEFYPKTGGDSLDFLVF